MQLTEHGRRLVDDLSRRHDFSPDAIAHMLSAVAAGRSTQAQFNHPEFGGMGQWSSGGMLMIGDMFNDQLKARVSSLCNELSELVQNEQMFAQPASSQTQSQSGGHQQQQSGIGQQQSGGQRHAVGQSDFDASIFVQGSGGSSWWPQELGNPASVGQQNEMRYAYFPDRHRLAIDINGRMTVYDTGEHRIGGFSQQQGGDRSITLTSQLGTVRVSELPVVLSNSDRGQEQDQSSPDAAQKGSGPVRPQAQVSSDEIFALIEKLADLKSKGVLTDTEYESKKSDLLSRL